MKVKIVNRIIALSAVILLTGITTVFCQPSGIIIITNPASLSRPNELIILKRPEVEKHFHPFPKFIAVSFKGKKLAVQHTDEDGDGQWDEALFLYSFKANEKASFTISSVIKNTETSGTQRAHVRMRKKNSDDSFGPNSTSETMPPQNPATDFSKHSLPMYLTEGPAWENDKVAFRLYFDVRNNKDIYGKTTAKMMMDTVGTNPKVSYHELSDWGMDILHVVKSLGAGALAISVPRAGREDTLIRLGGQNIKKTVYTQIADGPLLAKFNIMYNWEINDKPVEVKEEISTWGGQFFYESNVTVKGAPAGSELITGIAKFYENTFDTITFDKSVIGFSYGKQSENKDNLGLGILADKQDFVKADSINRRNTDVNETYTVTQKITENAPLYYRFYVGWERTDKRFVTAQGFKNYLKEEAVKYSEIIKVKWQ